MSTVALEPLQRARKLAGAASVLAVVAIVMILISTVLGDVVAPTVRALRSAGLTPDWTGLAELTRILGPNLIAAGPNLLLAGALGELCKVLKEYEHGRFFSLGAALGVRMTGEWALWALGFKILLAPTLLGYVTGEGRGFVMHFETFDLALIAFAAFVMLMGRVLEAAAAIKAENEEIV